MDERPNHMPSADNCRASSITVPYGLPGYYHYSSPPLYIPSHISPTLSPVPTKLYTMMDMIVNQLRRKYRGNQIAVGTMLTHRQRSITYSTTLTHAKHPDAQTLNDRGLNSPARGQPAGFWDGPVRTGISDDPVRLDGASGRTALTRVGRRVPAGQR